MIAIPIAEKRALRDLVTLAREEGPRQPWKPPPVFAKKTGNRARQGRLHRTMPQLKQDPAHLWAADIAQSAAEDALSALERGLVGDALRRAQRAAEVEAQWCAAPGLYARLAAQLKMLQSRLAQSPPTTPPERQLPLFSFIAFLRAPYQRVVARIKSRLRRPSFVQLLLSFA